MPHPCSAGQEGGIGTWRPDAMVSSALGGTAAAVTRYLVGDADPLTLAVLRWGIGFLCVLPVALLLRARWPMRRDWPAVAALGVCFFGLFFIFYNILFRLNTGFKPLCDFFDRFKHNYTAKIVNFIELLKIIIIR